MFIGQLFFHIQIHVKKINKYMHVQTFFVSSYFFLNHWAEFKIDRKILTCLKNLGDRWIYSKYRKALLWIIIENILKGASVNLFSEQMNGQFCFVPKVCNWWTYKNKILNLKRLKISINKNIKTKNW